MDTAIFNIPSLSCHVCSNRIQEGLKSIKGIEDVFVDLKSQSVKISYDPSALTPQDIKKEIYSMGYEAT